ncbi:MAG: hypothetical protein B6244_01475 [Candidatus Cloacimonetes bacterium 4572_55]|nr:MAG: hypothetical protein B6244_01475 [Candidatus Cloacimonetes bacterium 4572_55]
MFFRLTDPDNGINDIRDWMDQEAPYGEIDHVWGPGCSYAPSSYWIQANARIFAIADSTINFADYDQADPNDIDGDDNKMEPDGYVDYVFINIFLDHQNDVNCGATGVSDLRLNYETNDIGYNGSYVRINSQDGVTALFVDGGSPGAEDNFWELIDTQVHEVAHDFQYTGLNRNIHDLRDKTGIGMDASAALGCWGMERALITLQTGIRVGRSRETF